MLNLENTIVFFRSSLDSFFVPLINAICNGRFYSVIVGFFILFFVIKALKYMLSLKV